MHHPLKIGFKNENSNNTVHEPHLIQACCPLLSLNEVAVNEMAAEMSDSEVRGLSSRANLSAAVVTKDSYHDSAEQPDRVPGERTPDCGRAADEDTGAILPPCSHLTQRLHFSLLPLNLSG